MSKRFSLREFQQGFLDRLNDLGAAANRVTTLGALIGKDLWLIDMADISEVMPVPVLTLVPTTQMWFCGVANVRGNLYGVTDLNGFLNNELTQRDPASRVLLLGQKYGYNAGLLVSRVLGLRNAKEWQRIEQDGECFFQDSSGQRWRKLDVHGLIHRPEFLHIGA